MSSSKGVAGFMVASCGSSIGARGFTQRQGEQFRREKVRPARPGVGVSAKKFAQHTKNGPKMVLYGVLGEFFRGNAANSLTLGEFFRGRELEGLVWVAGGQSPVFKPPRHPV